MSNDGNDDDVCIACNIALKNGDKFYSDVDGGYLHAACAGPEREGYVGADGEPLKDGDPIPEPKTWVDPPPSSPVAGGGEEILPCPFCGGEATVNHIWNATVQIGCTPCRVNAPEFFTRDKYKAIAAWNRRSPLLSSPRVEEWQTMDTAPKDGTSIWGGWTVDGHTERVWWTADSGWVGSESGFWDSKNWPSHWRPLPPPPRDGKSRRSPAPNIKAPDREGEQDE